MEVIKRKILLEEATIRTSGDTWGTIPSDTFFYVKIPIYQKIDDMGLFTDMTFIPKTTVVSQPDYTILIDKLNAAGLYFEFMKLNNFPQTYQYDTDIFDVYTLRIPMSVVSDFYNFGNISLSGLTDTKLDDVRSYSSSQPYKLNFDINKETYQNYNNVTVDGVNRIISFGSVLSGNPITYIFDRDLTQPNTGIEYADYDTTLRLEIFSGDNVNNTTATTFKFVTEGWNQTNTSLSALMKEEFLLGIISRPEVENDVFIDRGVVPVLDFHLRLSEIRNIGELQEYGNGYYRIDRI